MKPVPSDAPASVSTTSAQQLTYPAAHTVPQVDDYFGTKVADPYRWMEDVDSAEVKEWVDAENTLTRSYLDKIPGRDAIKSRLMTLTNYERYTAPSRSGSRYFYSHNTGLQNQAVLFWQEGLSGEPHVLIDPNTLSADGTVALNGLSITDDGTLMAYAIADAGSDWVKWRVRNIATGKDTPDLIEWSKFSGAAWLKDNSGFFYEGYERPDKITKESSLKSTNYFHKIYFHKLGTPQLEDKLVFERPTTRNSTSAQALPTMAATSSSSRAAAPARTTSLRSKTSPTPTPHPSNSSPPKRLSSTLSPMTQLLLVLHHARRPERQGHRHRPCPSRTFRLEDPNPRDEELA